MSDTVSEQSAAPRPAPSPASMARQAQAAQPPAQVTGAQSLVLALESVGCDVVFGIPGGAILPAYDPLMDSVKVRHILVRHEQGAGHAAEGYASATGRVGVCMATSGPGATNLVTAIADAHMDSVPMVAITGQVSSAAIGELARCHHQVASSGRRTLLICPPGDVLEILEVADMHRLIPLYPELPTLIAERALT